MSIALVVLLVLIVGIVAAVLYVIAVYNRLVTLRNRFQERLFPDRRPAQTPLRPDSQPGRKRPRGYMKHERETLEAVIAARNQAAGAVSQASAAPGNAQAMALLSGAETALTGAFGTPVRPGRGLPRSEGQPDHDATERRAHLHRKSRCLCPTGLQRCGYDLQHRLRGLPRRPDRRHFPVYRGQPARS